MKLALVADHVLTRAGSERVFQYFCETFPDADVYTSVYNLDDTWEYYRTRPIKATWLNAFVRNHRTFKYAFPLTSRVMSGMDLRAYDAVLSLSATVSKYVRARPGRHLCYCLVPTRALWNEEDYFAPGLKKSAVKLVLSHLRARDFAAAQRVDRFLCISEVSRQLIQRHYHRDATILHSPIDVDRFARTHPDRSDRYLLVSRLERWKKIDYAIEAFNQLGWPLDIVGFGIDEPYLRRKAGPTIRFLGSLTDEALAKAYASARAVVFTPELEFGLIPLEANASGTPVVCLGLGAVHETMIPFRGNGFASAVFFDQPNAESLIGGLKTFEEIRHRFDPDALRRHAQQWSIPAFKQRIAEAVAELSGSARA